MKVEGHGGSVAYSKSGATRSTSGVSFAEVLASGRSVDTIRGERAFGFAETGILGASRRANSLEAGRASEARPTFARLPLLTQERRSGRRVFDFLGQRPSPLIAKGSSSSPQTFGQIITERANRLANGPFQLQAKNFWPQFHSVSSARSTIIGLPLREAIAHKRKPDFRRGKLSLMGSTQGLSIGVRLGNGEQVEEEDLYTKFYATCWQFGVTLEAIQLFVEFPESNFHSHESVRCK